MTFQDDINSNSTPQTRMLREAPIRRLLLHFSLPITVGMVVNGTYNIVDKVFVGTFLGRDSLAALTVSFPVMLIVLAFGMMVGHGAAAAVSLRLGEHKHDEAEKLVGQALFLFLVIGTLFILFGLTFLEPLLRMFSADETVLPLAKQYLTIIILGIFFQEISFGMNGLLSAEGKPRIAMMTMLIAAIANIVLDAVFIAGFRTGIWGAALATVLAQIISAVWIMTYYLSGRTLLKWRLSHLRFNWRLTTTIVQLGMPSFMMQAVSCFLQGLQNQQLLYYGNLYGEKHGIENGGNMALAAMGILFATAMLFLFPLLGISRGMQPIVGYNTGSRQYHRVLRTLLLGLAVSVGYATVCVIPLYYHAEWFVRCFGQEVNVYDVKFIQLATHAIRTVMVVLPAVAVVVVAAGYFQASGKPAISLTLTLLRQVVFLIPLILVLPGFLERSGGTGLDGVWLSMPISDMIACGFSTLGLVVEVIRLRRKTAEKDAIKPHA